MEMTVITKDYLGNSIEFKVIGGKVYGNANSMAKAFGGSDKIKNWKNSSNTERYIKALESRENDIGKFYLSAKGGAEQGTWIHEKLILNFARYLDVEFEIWADEQIATLLREGEVSLKPAVPQTYKEALLEVIRLEDEKERIALENKTKQEKIDRLTHVSKLYTSTEIAKELNLKSAIELNKKLQDDKIQFKVNDTWVLSARYSNLGYESIKQNVMDNGKVYYDRKWTQEGRDFLVNRYREF